MCFPGNKHPDFTTELNKLADHWSVGGATLLGIAGAAIRKIRDSQQAKRPQNLMMRNVTSSAGSNATLHYVDNIIGRIRVVCIADDRRNGADYCLNLLVIDLTQPGGYWIVHHDPFTVGADRA